MSAVQPKIYGLSDRPLARVHEFLTVRDQARFSRVCKKWKEDVAEYQARYLDPAKRPYYIQSKIDHSFHKLINGKAEWGFNGSPLYGLCEIPEHQLALKLILDGYPSRKDFYFMDVGAGNFQWGKALADFINSQNLSEDITVHIISVRAERHEGLSRIKEGRCVRYNLGAFKIEDLQSSLNREEFPRDRSFVDAAFTRWCLRHLVDPAEVAKEVIDMLRPETGLFLSDGFYTLRDSDTDPEEALKSARKKMVRLLSATKFPFLMLDPKDCSLNEFILRKSNANPCLLPLNYAGLHYSGKIDNQSGYVTIFKDTQPRDEDLILPSDRNTLYGSRDLFERLYKDELTRLAWKPIRESETMPKISLLHAAVMAGDLDAVKKHVRKSNIDDPNGEGETAVALAIKGERTDILQFLIKAGANVRLANYKGITPLDRALKLQNLPMTALLIENGAHISEENEKQLRDPVFKALGKLRFPSPTSYMELDIIHWLEMGDCVVLRQGWENSIFYKGSQPPSLEDVRVIGIDLEDGAMIGFLKKRGYYPRTSEFAKTIGLREDIPHAFSCGL